MTMNEERKKVRVRDNEPKPSTTVNSLAKTIHSICMLLLCSLMCVLFLLHFCFCCSLQLFRHRHRTKPTTVKPMSQSSFGNRPQSIHRCSEESESDFFFLVISDRGFWKLEKKPGRHRMLLDKGKLFVGCDRFW